SNLGNLDEAESLQLLGQLRERLCRGDRLLLGLDLQKDPRRILRAYDDEAGITARFNLNLLTRLNRELQMDFALDAFAHYASYSPLDGVARSFLVSLRAQRVRSRLLDQHFDFAAGESIYTEQSQKYTPDGVAGLLGAAGFALADTLLDELNGYAIFVGEAG
ncbi:MAG: L-histidine N(alpha)-methyltransferase, partial [Inhella sp.]